MRRITIHGFYYVPRGRTPRDNWHDVLTRTFAECQKFHEQQVPLPKLRFRIYRRPLYGTAHYDDEHECAKEIAENPLIQRARGVLASNSMEPISIACLFIEALFPSMLESKVYAWAAVSWDKISGRDYRTTLCYIPKNVIDKIWQGHQAGNAIVYHEIAHGLGLLDPPKNVQKRDESVMGSIGVWSHGLKGTYVSQPDTQIVLSQAIGDKRARRWAKYGLIPGWTSRKRS